MTIFETKYFGLYFVWRKYYWSLLFGIDVIAEPSNQEIGINIFLGAVYFAIRFPNPIGRPE